MRHPGFDRGAEADAVSAAQGMVQVLRDEQLSDFRRFRLDPYHLVRIETPNSSGKATVKAPRRGLAVPGSEAKHRALVVGQTFEVQHLTACCGQCFEEPGFAGPGLA